MNIALITDNFVPKLGGIKTIMVNIRNNLIELGENVYVFNSTYNNEREFCYKVISEKKLLKNVSSQGITFYIFIFALFFRIIFLFKGMRLSKKFKLAIFYCFYPKLLVDRIISIKNTILLFKKFKIDIILSGSAYRPLIYSFVLSKWFQIPMITYAHGEDYLKRLPLKVNTIMFQNIENIIVSNKIMKNLMLKLHYIDPIKIKIIHYGVDIENSKVNETVFDLRTKYNIAPDDFIILTVSRLYPRKGFETVLNAVKLILDENPSIPIKYFIIGSGNEEQLIKKLIKNLNLEDNVKLLGRIEGHPKNQYYKLSDLFVLVPEIKNNSIEGFGIVYIEANYFKLPVIGSRSGGVKMAIEDGKTGFLINSKDEVDLKEKILLLYNDEDLRHTLGLYGQKRVINYFDWKKNVAILREVIKNTINEFRSKNR
jgi:phosphatidylinositol alpha-1,6-mannosyltransferase